MSGGRPTWLTPRRRVLLFAVIVVLAVVASVVQALRALDDQRVRETQAAVVDLAPNDSYAGQPRIVFRNTSLGKDYGLVAEVPLTDPAAPRAVSDLACDRVDAASGLVSCLQTRRGVVTRYRWLELDAEHTLRATHPLPGIPSRTRLSEDGALVASTSFVTGHAYMATGFSTATVVRHVGGRSVGNLEDFELVLDGRVVRPADRNVWGVTFGPGDTFYATVATGGTPYLVKGDLSERRMESLISPGECPSLSPDRTRLAYKVDTRAGSATLWKLAVLDLRTGERTMLRSPAQGVDDQVEWLDDDTLLFGLGRADEPGVTDVWSLAAKAGARPELLLEQAWSPSVVR